MVGRGRAWQDRKLPAENVETLNPIWSSTLFNKLGGVVALLISVWRPYFSSEVGRDAPTTLRPSTSLVYCGSSHSPEQRRRVMRRSSLKSAIPVPAYRATSADSLGSPDSLGAESLYVGIDVGKQQHVAGFLSTTLLARHQRFEHCPALVFANSRLGFRQVRERICSYVSLAQAYVALEVTGHYHHALVQYLQELDIPVFILHPQARQAGLLKTDKRDALGLANLLYAQLDRGVQLNDPFLAVRRLVSPTPAAERLRGVVQHRLELVSEMTQRKNKLTAICDELFPEMTQICKDPNLVSALALRKRFPTPEALAAASLEELQATRVGHHPSDSALVTLRHLAAESIGVRTLDRVRGLVFEQG